MLLIVSLACFQLVVAAQAETLSTTEGVYAFNEQQRSNRFFEIFKNWANTDLTPRQTATLCIGSSSMRLWRTLAEDLVPLELINRGFGGSQMSDVLVFQSYFNRFEAERIIVYQGDNDLAQSDNIDKFIDECRSFVKSIHSTRADTSIYFISIKPSIRRAVRTSVYAEANARLKVFCDSDDRLHYIDIFTPMLDEAGNPRAELMADDMLHINAKGYALWTGIVRDALGLDPLGLR